MFQFFTSIILLLTIAASPVYAESYVFQWPSDVSSEPTTTEGSGGTGGTEEGSGGSGGPVLTQMIDLWGTGEAVTTAPWWGWEQYALRGTGFTATTEALVDGGTSWSEYVSPTELWFWTPEGLAGDVVTVTTVDSEGLVSANALQLTLTASYYLFVGGAYIPDAQVGEPYTYDLSVHAQHSGFNLSEAIWSARSTLPAGLSVTSTGVVQGVPTEKHRPITQYATFIAGASFEAEDSEGTYYLKVEGAYVIATQIARGGYHSCALTSSGSVVCWGRNNNGQLGDGTFTDSFDPVTVSGISNATHVAAGAVHTCATHSGGAVSCWGNGSSGQLGDGSTTTSNTPVQVSGLNSGVTKLTTEGSTNCVIHSGAAKCWGNGSSGQLGVGVLVSHSTTPLLVNIESVIDISAGGSHTCAVTTLGAAKCWGFGSDGQLGIGLISEDPWYRVTPTDVAGLGSQVASISAAGVSTCSRMVDGTAKCWGENGSGQLGNGVHGGQYFEPVDVLISPIAEIKSGGSVTCAVDSAGVLKCWGSNYRAQLGTGNSTPSFSLTPLTAAAFESGITDFVAGGCAIGEGNRVKCWGGNYYGQAGSGGSSDHLLIPGYVRY